MPPSSPPDVPEHEMQTYFRVRDKIDAALDKIACLPSVSFALKFNPKFTIARRQAGTFIDPDVDLILKISKPSAFGRGEKTVMHPTYRNGREIIAADITVDNWYFIHDLEKVVSASMFAGRLTQIKLYKVAVYEQGGHFDWHRDSTHSDKHHATLLVALNTRWSGGDLVLRRNDVETRVDLHPSVRADERGEDKIFLKAVAFYTDVEHKIEPLSDGVRVVFQYDVEIIGGETDNKEESDEEMYIGLESILFLRGKSYGARAKCRDIVSATPDPAVLAKIITIIQELHASGRKEVSWPLQHLYRKASIHPEYLKGSDASLYEALASTFDVALHPVVLCEAYGEGGVEELCVHKYDQNGESEGDEAGSVCKDVIIPPARFYLPEVSAIQHGD